ncbi:MAG: PH domain-containing protein, partial [Clostridia bacterium]|nr:PH domain-containing protein [Clostridia bacterium]
YLFDPRGFWEHIASYAVSIFMTCTAVLISAADYSRRSVTMTDRYISVAQGLLVRSEYRIPYTSLHCFGCTQSPFSRLAGVVKITLAASRCDGRRGGIYLPKERADKVSRAIYGSAGDMICTIRSQNSRVFLTSALLANPVGGVLAAAPIISGIGRAAGIDARDAFLQELNFSQYFLLLGVPPLTAFIAYFLIAMYMVSVAVMFERNFSLRCTVFDGGICIGSGAVIKKEWYVPFSRISGVRCRQTMLMRAFGICSYEVKVLGKWRRICICKKDL